MLLAENLKIQKLALVNFAANAALGTAAATVDIASSVTIAQTTAAIVLTIPSPTVTTDTNILMIQNIGTVAITVGGVVIGASKYQMFLWTGTAWVAQHVAAAQKFYIQQILALGANVITHNLNLATPKAISVFMYDDATGSSVTARIGTQTANAVTITTLAAAPLTNIIIIG